MIDWLLGISLKSEQLHWWQMCNRALVMYIALIAIIRLGKKRSLGRTTAFDAVLMIIVGSVAARAITGGAPFIPRLMCVALLVALHWVFSGISRRSPAFGDLIKGTPTRIVNRGKIDKKAMADAHMSQDDLAEDLRKMGVEDTSGVKLAVLERDGKLSVIKSKQCS